jgi:hypothetical protein
MKDVEMFSSNDIQDKLIGARDVASNAWRRLIDWMRQLLHLRGSRRSGILSLKDHAHGGVDSREQQRRNDVSLEVNRILIRLRHAQRLAAHGDFVG